MSWSESNKMDLRYAAVKQYFTGNFTKTQICEIYGISRPILDKWITRFEAEGIPGLQDRSSRPLSSPNETPKEVVDYILSINEKWGWLAKNIFTHIKNKKKELDCPTVGTIHRILEKNDRTHKYKRYNHYIHPGKPICESNKPNDVWATDYKGQFNTGDGKKCYPLTITCTFSRMLIGAFPHLGPRLEDSKRDFTRAFREFGMPTSIISDNGTPFSSRGIDGLSQLNVWWTELGITHIRTQPASPQQNGRHERMHREMKRETTRPAGKNLKEQTRMMDEFRQRYNEERGHGGINDVPPISIYSKSEVQFPEVIKGPEYPNSFVVRKVSDNGGFRWNNEWVNLSQCLGLKNVGLEEIDDGLWKIFFYNRFLGFFDELSLKVLDKSGPIVRD